LITGETEENENPQDWQEYINTSDILWAGEVSDDDNNWGQYLRIAFSGRVGSATENEWYDSFFYRINNQDEELYYYDGIPFNWNISDWNKVQFRQTFVSDDDGVQNIGYYTDDYIIFGNDNFTVPYRVGVTEFTIPQVSNVPMVHPNEGATFSSKVKNYGDTNTFDVKLIIKDMETGDEGEDSKKPVSNLQQGTELTHQWSWTPQKEGDFLLTIVAGDTSQDWTPFDNEESRLVHVRAPADQEILVVDDDNGLLNGGVYYREVEGKMLNALDLLELEYDVYTVDTNATGPSSTIME
jgi:hypothetical protein